MNFNKVFLNKDVKQELISLWNARMSIPSICLEKKIINIILDIIVVLCL